MKKILYTFAAALLLLSCGRKLQDGEHVLTIITTNDVHGTWFDESYTGGEPKRSLMAISTYVDSIRTADGENNVLLLDAGDCLQGDNAAYYFNYVDTLSPHIFPRLAKYMRYDAIAVGNHDIETGHPVYDRVAAQLQAEGIPFLGGNAIRNDNGKPYFPLYTVVEKAGLKVAVIGYTNANMKGWLSEEIWSGMHFVSIAEVIGKDVEAVRKKEHPDVVVALIHSGAGFGDGSILESEALDIFGKVDGVDWVICSHDHRPYTEAREDCALLNSGSHSRYLAEGKMHVSVKDGKVESKSFEARLIPVDPAKADEAMKEQFKAEYDIVKDFTLREIGCLNVPMRTRDAFTGMSPYIDLVHSICIAQEPAQISIAAPLTYNGSIPEGRLIFNDLFTIYPFENQLYVISMSGEEIKRYLEASYNRWINTWTKAGDHVLKIVPKDNMRYSQTGWSFEERSYNFDSVAGLNYTVDVTKPAGERVFIISMADGSAFDLDRNYNVAVTSYRASGGGDLLKDAGIDVENIDQRIVKRYPEIRNLLYQRLQEDDSIDPEEISDPNVLGSWKFVPENIAGPVIKADMELLFGK